MRIRQRFHSKRSLAFCVGSKTGTVGTSCNARRNAATFWTGPSVARARFAVLAQPVESAAATIFGKLAPTVRKAVRSYCVHVKEMFNGSLLATKHALYAVATSTEVMKS
jgi:hypothetical protein